MATAAAADSRKEKYVTETRKVVAAMTKMVETAEKRFSILEGASKLLPARMMASKAGSKNMAEPLWNSYYEWMTSVGVSSKKEMEELQKSFGDNQDALKCTKELHAVEAQFTEMMSRMNAMVQKGEDRV